MTTKRKLEVMVSWGHCYLCLQKLTSLNDTEFDHVIPLELGGSDEPDNIRPAHAECHRKKTKGDARDIAKMRRRVKREEDHHRAIESRGTGEKRKRTSRIPSRPMRPRPKIEKRISDDAN